MIFRCPRNSRLRLALCGVLLLAGCATHKHAPRPKHRLVGTIVTVNDSNRFVLIDAGPLYPASPGEALKSFQNGQETGVLTVSPERRSSFIIADIVKGTPHQGDQVFD